MTSDNISHLNRADKIVLILIPLTFSIGVIGLKINQDPIEQIGFFGILISCALILAFLILQVQKVNNVLLGVTLFGSLPLVVISLYKFLHWFLNIIHIGASIALLIVVLVYLIKEGPKLFSRNKFSIALIFLIALHGLYATLTFLSGSLPVYSSGTLYYSVFITLITAGIAILIWNKELETRTLLICMLMYPLFECLKLLWHILPPYN